MLKDNVLEEYDFLFAAIVILLFLCGLASKFIFNDLFHLIGADIYKTFFVFIFLLVVFNKLSSDFDDEAEYEKAPSKSRKRSDFHLPVLFYFYVLLNHLIAPFFVGVLVSTILTTKI